MLEFENYQVHIVQCANSSVLSQLYKFRESSYQTYLPEVARGLIKDSWDKNATHIIAYHKPSSTIVASARICRSQNDTLPFVENLPSQHKSNIQICKSDTEISRVLAHKNYRKTGAFRYLLYGLVHWYLQHPDYAAYIDVIDSAETISKQNYLRLGFKETGILYFDTHYGKNSEVLYASADTMRKMARNLYANLDLQRRIKTCAT